MSNNCKFHCQYVGKGFWEVFVTEDSWDTFSFMMQSLKEPTHSEIEEVWMSEEKKVHKVF